MIHRPKHIMVDLAIVEANFAVWNEANYGKTVSWGRHKYVRHFYNNKDILECLTISECRERWLADVWYQDALAPAGEEHERGENVRCGAGESVYFLYQSFPGINVVKDYREVLCWIYMPECFFSNCHSFFKTKELVFWWPKAWLVNFWIKDGVFKCT